MSMVRSYWMPKSAGSVVVMGAGPAGLAAGMALSHAGWSVRVVEAMDCVGGLARTIEHDDFRFDIGGHRWFTKKDELNQFFVNLLQEEVIWVDRISRVYFDGKYVDYPLRARNVMTRISPATGARALADFAVAQTTQTFNPKPINSMEDAYVAQFGRTLYELFFRRYSEKVWGRPCTELSGDWVSQRSNGLSLMTTIRDALKRTDGKVQSLVEKFMYPRYGYGRISERMADAIIRGGGRVDTGQRVVAAHHDGQRITGVTVSDGRREERIDADVVISSIPMTELAQILTPSADTAVLEAAKSLTYRDLVTVHLMLDRPQVTNDTWVYLHDPALKCARLHEPRNWSPDMAPPGKTSLVVEYFADMGDELWQQTDDDICELAVDELADTLHFIDKNDVMGAFAVRSRDAYPRYDVQYAPSVDRIKDHLRSFENLSIVGRGGTFRYNNTDHAIETGLLAARQILGETVDLDSVNREAEYLETRRVERQVPVAAG
jgi:protoporphyrinogen oxidase